MLWKPLPGWSGDGAGLPAYWGGFNALGGDHAEPPLSPRTHASTGQGQHPPCLGGLLVLWGVQGLSWWCGVAGHRGPGETTPPCPSLAPGAGQPGWLSSTLVFIYLPVKFLWQGPGVRRPGRNIPETPPTALALLWDHRHSAATPADPTCHARPPAPWSLEVAVPRIQGHCATVWLGAGSLPCPTSHRGSPLGDRGTWGGGWGTPIVPDVLSPLVHASSRGSSWVGSSSALTVRMVLLGHPQCRGPRGTLGRAPVSGRLVCGVGASLLKFPVEE